MKAVQVCFEFGGPNCFGMAPSRSLIELQQTDFDEFTVVYGLQVKKRLDYGEAAAELGACVMHLQTCEGKLDNRSRSEAREAGDRKPYFGV